jgi:hypothetical protein
MKPNCPELATNFLKVARAGVDVKMVKWQKIGVFLKKQCFAQNFFII